MKIQGLERWHLFFLLRCQFGSPVAHPKKIPRGRESVQGDCGVFLFTF